MKIDLNVLKSVCLARVKDFAYYGQVLDDKNFSVYIDNKSDILAVAHLDYVNLPFVWAVDEFERFVYCPRLDDRLGVYICLYLLPELGINVDVLLTSGEESCNSSAAFFNPGKNYKWGVEFDRRGDDVVTYRYANKDFHTILEKSGFFIGRGSFSDISVLDIGVRCFNVGVGYEYEHTLGCYFDIAVLKRQLACFEDFYFTNKDTSFPFTPAVSKVSYGSGWSGYTSEWFKTDWRKDALDFSKDTMDTIDLADNPGAVDNLSPDSYDEDCICDCCGISIYDWNGDNDLNQIMDIWDEYGVCPDCYNDMLDRGLIDDNPLPCVDLSKKIGG
jgi:hypothetical protein